MNDERTIEQVPAKESSVNPLTEVPLADGSKIVKDKGGRWQVETPRDPKAKS